MCISTACGEPEASANSPAGAQLEELRLAIEPLKLTETSDKQDAWFHRKAALLERSRQAHDVELGRLAWKAFQDADPERQDLRVAFLEVAAFNAPEVVRPELERMTVEYDGHTSLGVRTEAARLLAETSPAEAIRVFEPILRETKHRVTYPPQEELLRYLIRASELGGGAIDELLIDIATDILQPSEVRYVAIASLAKVRTVRAQKALESLLVETSSDGLLRRKAAQAVRDGLPQSEACEILQRVAEHESDEAFLRFLADMLDKLCP
jgi:hypothetical protein